MTKDSAPRRSPWRWLYQQIKVPDSLILSGMVGIVGLLLIMGWGWAWQSLVVAGVCIGVSVLMVWWERRRGALGVFKHAGCLTLLFLVFVGVCGTLMHMRSEAESQRGRQLISILYEVRSREEAIHQAWHESSSLAQFGTALERAGVEWAAGELGGRSVLLLSRPLRAGNRSLIVALVVMAQEEWVAGEYSLVVLDPGYDRIIVIARSREHADQVYSVVGEPLEERLTEAVSQPAEALTVHPKWKFGKVWGAVDFTVEAQPRKSRQQTERERQDSQD